MIERANTEHPVHEVISSRWSPYAFADRSVSRGDLHSLFEAARWAPSSANEQPWGFLVATREEPEELARMLSCLVEFNQAWAQAAPVLLLGCIRLSFEAHGSPNPVAGHDLGLATANLMFEATSRGLSVHVMAGILPDRAREVYAIPEGVQPLTAIAIGYAGTQESLPEKLRERDAARRPRKPQSAFVFHGKWGSPA